MKQMIKYTLEIAAMLLVTLGASAQTAQTANIIYKLDGTVQTTGSMPGSVNVDFTNGTITITPGEGNYFHLKKAEDLKVVKVIDGSHATTRDGEPGFNTSIAITPKDETADPSKTTVYTFTKLEDTNYGLEVTANFHSRISVENATVSGLKDSYTYTGEAIKPVVTVKVGDNTLTLDKDYRAFYSDSINASTNAVKGKITLYGICEYMGTQQIEYIIAKADPTLTFSPTTATITFGKETAFEKPVLTTTPAGLAVTYQVKDGDDGVAQVNSADGGITPLVPGQATIEAVFAGNANYNEAKGQYTLTVAKGTAVVTVAPVAKDNLTYTGGDQELVNEGTATDGTMMYRIGTEGDFSADIPKGNAAGEYTVYYKAVAINSDQFNDSEALSITVTIKPKSIENATITLTPESFTYNGQNQKPTTVTVKDGETDLVLDQDYTLTNDGGTNVGEYTVTVTGKDNYDSQTTASKTFNITALETTPTVTLNETSFVYDGTEKKPAVTVTVVLPGATASTELTTDDYDVAYSENVNVGVNTAKATVTLKRNYVGQNTATFTITPKSIANATIKLTPESFTFNGENQKPTTVTVKDGETNLVLDTDYTLTNEGGTDAGKYTVTVTGKGNYSGTASKEYSITSNTMEVTAEGYTGTYDGKAHGITVTAPKGATIKYGTAEGTYDLTTNPSYTNVGTYTVYYQVSMENYADVTGSKNVVISQATVTLSYSASTAEGKMGKAFTAPTLNNPSQVAIAYSSSNTEVATIGTDGVVTLTGAGKTTITATFAGNDNYASATASYELTVGKQQDAGLSWTDEGMEYYIGDYWYGPRLNNPNNLKIKYESSDEDVATIDENGVITVLGVGDTWIMAIFEGSDEYEPQTVRYGLFVKERYNLWVDGTQVTSDNRRDILGDGQFFYDEDKKMLVVTNSTKAVDIENRKGDLTIFLNGNSKLGRIFFNKGETDNSGKLTITTYENIPGATTLETSDANGVISGFSSMTIDEESYTFLLDPTKGQYQGGKLVTAEGAVAQTAIIGQYIKPLVNGQTVTFPPGDFDIKNLTNAVIKDLLMTLLMDLGTSQVETDDDYYDASENCIVLNNLNSTNGVAVVVDNVQKGQYIPGSSDFAAAFKGGITFMVPNGEGKIILNVQTEPGYKLMLMIGNGTPTEIVKNERGDVEVDYNVEKPTYCYIYLDQTAGTRGTRIGKREKSHGKVFSLKVSPAKSLSTNPLGGVPGFPDSKTPEVDTFGEDDPTGINEIKVETDNTLEGNDDNWYDLQGRRIDKPTKAGIYIQNRKKVVIR